MGSKNDPVGGSDASTENKSRVNPVITGNERSHIDGNGTAEEEMMTGDDIFQCRMCGACCSGFGGTYVSQADIERISAFIGCDPGRFTSKYCSPSGSRWVLATADNGKCVFFDDNITCTIHPVKPTMCRAWPFIRTVVTHPENWDAMANSCPGMKKGVSHDTLQRIVSEEIKKRKN